MRPLMTRKGVGLGLTVSSSIVKLSLFLQLVGLPSHRKVEDRLLPIVEVEVQPKLVLKTASSYLEKRMDRVNYQPVTMQPHLFVSIRIPSPANFG